MGAGLRTIVVVLILELARCQALRVVWCSKGGVSETFDVRYLNHQKYPGSTFLEVTNTVPIRKTMQSVRLESCPRMGDWVDVELVTTWTIGR